MADLHTYNKLPSDPCLTQEQITAYIDGKLSAAEQHACEKHIIDCALCEDAAEGLALVKDRSVLAVPLMNGASKAPADTEEAGKVVPLHQPNRKVWYAAAAVLVVLLGSALLLRMMSGNDMGPLAENTSHKMDSVSLSEEQKAITLKEEVPADERTGEANTPVAGTDGVAPAPPKAQKNIMSGILSDEVEEGNVAIEAEAPAEDVVMVPEVPALGETYLRQENDGDKSKDASVFGAKEKTEDAKPEETKKTSFWDRTKANIPAGYTGPTMKQSEKQTLANDQRTDTNDDKEVPAQTAKSDNAGTTAPAPESVNSTGGATSTSYDLYNDSGVNYSSTVSVQDSAKVGDNLELSYINGVNLLAAGQANAAISMFEKVLTNKEHPRYEDAEFQKAKALIKANRKEEAKTLLKAIETKKGKHAAEATELLKTL